MIITATKYQKNVPHSHKKSYKKEPSFIKNIFREMKIFPGLLTVLTVTDGESKKRFFLVIGYCINDTF